MSESARVSWGGRIAVVVAVLLYTGSLLFSCDFEPLLILGVLILLPIGLYRTTKASSEPPATEDQLTVRLTGPGKPGTPERRNWASAQIRRGRSIRTAILSVLIAALALFVENHVTGSICCSLSEQAAPRQKEECEEGALVWETQADRLGDVPIYETKRDDDLAKIALTRDIAPSLIGPENIAAVLVADGPLAKALDAENPKQLENQRFTIEEISRRLELTPVQVAARFSTTPLEAGQFLKIPTDRPYDPRQWADWLLWTLVGLAAYLLTEVASNLRKVVDGEGNFLGETTWYWTQLAIGPLVAFVILLLFVHIDIDLLTGDEAAVEVNLREYPSDLLIVPAFLLGFYSRVAREVLDQLMRRIFGAAWRATHGEFEILIKGQAGDDEISSSSTAVFETQPSVSPMWSATAGTIDPGGVFNPPPVTAPKPVFITAIAAGSNRAVTKAVTVVKHKFQVMSTGNPGFELHPGQLQELTIAPLPSEEEEKAKITWSLVDPVPKGVFFEGNKLLVMGPTVTLTVPETHVPAPGETVTIKVTYADLSRTIPFKVTPRLSIKAKVNGNPLEQKVPIAVDTKVQFKAISDLSSGQLAQTKWSAEPPEALAFDSAAGEEVTGTVKGSGAVIAAHPQKGKARFELTV